MAERNYAAQLMTASNAEPPAREPTYAERIANFFRPWTDEERARVAEVMPPDLAPTQIVKGMVGGAADLAMQANQAMPWGGNYPQAIGIDPQAGTIDPSVMVPFAQNVAGMATTGSLAAPAMRNATGMGIRAYHGSPHDFDRFSMDKIGTGEGAQAYGHGLYFAENEGVAQGYRDALKMKGYDNNQMYREAVNNHGFGAREFDQFESLARQTIHDPDVLANAFFDWNDEWRPLRNDPAEYQNVRDFAEKYINSTPKGRMYEVDINASPDEFINYDAPWADQPDVVKRHFSRLAKNGTGPDGSDLARRIESGVWLDEARNAGIKGIRYKDAGSRATSGGELLGIDRGADGWKAKVRVTNRSGVGIQAPADMVTTSKAFPTEEAARQWAESKIGGGTSNYVVFDDNTINILKKYGIAGLTAGGAGAAMLGGSPDPASAAAPSYSTGGRF